MTLDSILPLLDSVEALQGRDGDKDDNSLLAVANFDLIKTQVSRRAPGQSLGPLPVLFHRSQWFTGIKRQRFPPMLAGQISHNQAVPSILSNHRRVAARGRSANRSAMRIALGTGFRASFVAERLRKKAQVHGDLTSRAETNWRGRRATFRSAVLVSRSYRAWAMFCSSSEGFCREGLWGEILFMALILAVGVQMVVE